MSSQSKPARYIFINLYFWLFFFFDLQNFGVGMDFCFDGSKEGERDISEFC